VCFGCSGPLPKNNRPGITSTNTSTGENDGVRVLVYPHELSIGGSQLNAVELAAAVRDLGHEVAIFGVPGPLAGHIGDLGLDLIPAPESGRRPSPAIARRLAQVVRADGIDLVHGYEWPPALEAWYGPGLLRGTAAVGTVLSMGVAGFLPRSLPLIVGTEQLRTTAARRWRSVHLIEPPVDTAANHPGIPTGELRERFGLDDRRLTIVAVSRLAVDLKLEGLERAVAAVGELAADFPVRLVIAGDGPARDRLGAAADLVNQARGEGTVVLTGELLDPRPAYALADVVLGMGGSILRAMAYAKPAVVLGEDGFSELLTPETSRRFLWHGFYGLGDGELGPARLAGQLRRLLADEGLRARLGAFSARLVAERFSLTGAGRSLEGIYRSVLAGPVARPRALAESVLTGVQVVDYKLARRRARRRGTSSTDDFNARPEILPVPEEPSGTQPEPMVSR
jgi:glycosyltransferase involved in cell wall biosynthesis